MGADDVGEVRLTDRSDLKFRPCRKDGNFEHDCGVGGQIFDVAER